MGDKPAAKYLTIVELFVQSGLERTLVDVKKDNYEPLDIDQRRLMHDGIKEAATWLRNERGQAIPPLSLKTIDGRLYLIRL